NLTCKDQVKLEANTAGRQAGAFALGLTIVGAPIAFELEKAKQREVYKSCMEARGYRVLPPNDGPPTAAQSSPPPETPSPARTVEPTKPVAAPATTPSAQTPSSGPNRDEAVQLQKLKELREKGLITEEEYERKRKEILDRL